MQIYRFEQFTPPALNEHTLRMELERRQLRRRAMLSALGGLLWLFALALAAVWLRGISPALSTLCGAYVGCAAVGAAVIALIFRKRRRLAV